MHNFYSVAIADCLSELECTQNIRKKRKKARPELWHRNIVKQNRLCGEEYINRKGKSFAKKIPKPVSCDKCR